MVHAVFPLVLYGAIGLFVVVGVLASLTHRNLHDQIGQGGMFVGDDPFGGGGGGGGSGAWGGEGTGAWGADLDVGGYDPPAPGSPTEQELEIRQMLQARSDRLVRRGEAPLDLDAELARLLPPDGGGGDGPGAVGAADGGGDGEPGSHDPMLTAEVRQLVQARNDRRRRQGLEALDVEAEVRRTLAELDP